MVNGLRLLLAISPLGVLALLGVWSPLSAYAREDTWQSLEPASAAGQNEVASPRWLVHPQLGSALFDAHARHTTDGNRLILERGRLDLDTAPGTWVNVQLAGIELRLSGSVRFLAKESKRLVCLDQGAHLLSVSAQTHAPSTQETPGENSPLAAGCYALETDAITTTDQTLSVLPLPEDHTGLVMPFDFEVLTGTDQTVAAGEGGDADGGGSTDLAPGAGEGACLEGGDGSTASGDVNSERPSVEVEKENASLTIRVRWK